MPRRPKLAPQLIYNQRAPTTTGEDIRRMGSSRPLALLQTTTAREGLMGADAAPYVKVEGKAAKELFASKYVPMTDDTDVLKSKPGRLMSQRGYGNRPCKYPGKVPKDPRIGFNNTLVDTTSGGFKVSKAGIIHHPQNAVYTDFHKGVLAGYDPASQPQWADGTYDKVVSNMIKDHSGLPEDVTFLPPPDRRRELFELQSLAGGEVFGDALLRKQMNEYFGDLTGRAEEIARMVQQETGREISRERLKAILEQRAKDTITDRLARRLGLPKDNATVAALAKEIAESPEVMRDITAQVDRYFATPTGSAAPVALQPRARAATPTRTDRQRLRAEEVMRQSRAAVAGQARPLLTDIATASAPTRATTTRSGGASTHQRPALTNIAERGTAFLEDVFGSMRSHSVPVGDRLALPAPPVAPMLTDGGRSRSQGGHGGRRRGGISNVAENQIVHFGGPGATA